MNYVISGYEPARVFEIFEDLCAIPHGSGNEKGIADYIEKFANDRNIFAKRDETGNIFLRKDATVGYKNTAPVILQGHMDMVCEKNSDSNHDFLRDGLTLKVVDGMLWADGTTLGADNGIAVAMMLALLETNEHPTLECLFTVEEETGLAGAKGFDCSCVTAKRMINLDSEEDWQITAGCAGGCRTEVDVAYDAESIPSEYTCLDISVTGLSGGHSGAEIHCGKTNAIIAMGRLLAAAYEKESFNIVSLTCNGKDNAIARECFATIAVKDADATAQAILSEADRIRSELSKEDEGFTVSAKQTNTANRMLNKELSKTIVTFLTTVKTGVLKMSNQIKGLVEYSRNIGVVETDSEKIKLTLSSRSSIEAQLDLSCRELDMLCAALGVECHHYARYPGWEYAPISPLRDSYIAAFKELYGKDLSVGVIHAGLECGILSSKLEGMDIISIGPNMYDIHSPCEHLDLASCEKIWKALVKVITSK